MRWPCRLAAFGRLEVHCLAEPDQPHARSSCEILDRFTTHQVRKQPIFGRRATDLYLYAHAAPLPHTPGAVYRILLGYSSPRGEIFLIAS